MCLNQAAGVAGSKNVPNMSGTESRLVALSLLIPHLRMTRESALLPRETLVQFIPAPADWLRPTPLAVSWRWIGEALPGQDDPWVAGKMMFAGLVPLLGAALGLTFLV